MYPYIAERKTSRTLDTGTAAGLLVRLYLNAKVWIGEDHYADCKQWAEDIIAGKYGTYSINQQDYRDPFRSGINKYQSPENMFEFLARTRSFGTTDDVADGMHYSAAQNDW